MEWSVPVVSEAYAHFTCIISGTGGRVGESPEINSVSQLHYSIVIMKFTLWLIFNYILIN